MATDHCVQSSFRSCNVAKVPACFSTLVAVCLLALASNALSAQQSVTAVQKLRLSRALAQTPVGTAEVLKKLGDTDRVAVSLAAGDFFGDGLNGLVTGYSLGSGGVIAVQQGSVLPRPDELDAVAPFVATAGFIDVGVRPDFLKSADLNGDGHQDLVVATRGGRSLQILFGNGRGNFTLQPALPVAGNIASLSTWKNSAGVEMIAVGVCGGGCSVDLYTVDGSRFASIPVADRPTLLEVARVNGSGVQDLIAGGSSALAVIDGRTIASLSPRIDKLPIAGAVSAAAGWFVYDRRNFPQIAVLTSDGSVHTLARTGVESAPLSASTLSGPGTPRGHATTTFEKKDPSALVWVDAETLPGVASFNGGVQPLLIRTRLSGSGMDDLLVLNANGGHTTSIAHPEVSINPEDGKTPGHVEVLPARIQTEANASGAVLAAMPLRISQDSRLGLVTAEAGAHPMVTPPATGFRTLTVNSATDGAVPSGTNPCTNGGTCTLRDAFAQSNADASHNETSSTVDIIQLQASTTYTLSYNTGRDTNGNSTYHIEIYGPVNVVGAGAASTTITTNQLDKIFSINSGFANNAVVAQTSFDTFFSGITLTNAQLTNNEFVAAQANSDGVGGILDAETGGHGYITFVNCNLTNSTSPYGDGGAIYVSDGFQYGSSTERAPGPGTLEIDGGTISGNTSSEDGGAISTATDRINGNVPIILNGVTISNNKANNSINTADIYGGGKGGGVYFLTDSGSGVESLIIDSVVSGNSTVIINGNTGSSEGGGLYAGSGLKLTNNQFTGNTAASSGGGIYESALNYSPLFTGNTITANAATDGGGILLLNDTGNGGNGLTATIQYNRIKGNTASATGGRTGLGVGTLNDADTFATVTASENFWGCNTGPGGTGCDTATAGGTGTLTVVPYAVATASLSSNAPTPGSTLTLTGGILKDSGGTTISGGNLNAFTGVTGTSTYTSSGYTSTSPGGLVTAKLTIAQGANTLAASTTATNTIASATLTANITASGAGTGTVVIDNATSTANFSVTVLSPTIQIAFGASTIPVSGTTSLTFTLANPNTGVSATGVAFFNPLPSGLVVASVPATTNTCGGTLTATAGGSSISLSGSTINASSNCAISVNVTSTTAGVKSDTTGGVTSTNESVDGAPSNTATINVLAPPTISKAFGTSSLAAGATTSLTFTLANPDTATQSGIAFSDTFPAGLTIASPSGLTGACGGSVTATAGGSSVTLSGGSLTANTNCTIAVNVTDSTPGGITNTTGNVSSTQGGTGLTASAGLTVTGTPTITLAAPATANRGYTTTLTATFTTVAGAAVPTKSVNFYAGATLLGTQALTLATATTYTATFMTSALPSGSQSLTAVYPTGDPNYNTATSNAVTTFVVANNIWIGNTNNTVSAYQPTGVPLFTTAETTGGTGVAIDSTGSVWSLNTASASVAKFTNTGTVTSAGYSGGGLSAPTSLAIDGAGVVWITNGNNSLSVFANTGTPVSTTAYVGGSGGNLSTPTSVSIDPSGNLWIANSGNSTVTEVLGVATPTVAPLSTGVANNTLATKP